MMMMMTYERISAALLFMNSSTSDLAPWSIVLVMKLTLTQLVDKFLVLYRAWMFITVFTTAHNCKISLTSYLQFTLTSFLLMINPNSTLPSLSRSVKWPFSPNKSPPMLSACPAHSSSIWSALYYLVTSSWLQQTRPASVTSSTFPHYYVFRQCTIIRSGERPKFHTRTKQVQLQFREQTDELEIQISPQKIKECENGELSILLLPED
jgi:hypothetical protein